jgi:hypothetical protein
MAPRLTTWAPVHFFDARTTPRTPSRCILVTSEGPTYRQHVQSGIPSARTRSGVRIARIVLHHQAAGVPWTTTTRRRGRVHRCATSTSSAAYKHLNKTRWAAEREADRTDRQRAREGDPWAARRAASNKCRQRAAHWCVNLIPSRLLSASRLQK